jgi:hypothetical protein
MGDTDTEVQLSRVNPVLKSNAKHVFRGLAGHHHRKDRSSSSTREDWMLVAKHDSGVPTLILYSQRSLILVSLLLVINDAFIDDEATNISLFSCGILGITLTMFVFSINNFSKTIFLKLFKDPDIMINIICLILLAFLAVNSALFRALSLVMVTLVTIITDAYDVKSHTTVLVSLILLLLTIIGKIFVQVTFYQFEFSVVLYKFNELSSLKLGSMKITIYFMLFFYILQALVTAIKDPSEKKL